MFDADRTPTGTVLLESDNGPDDAPKPTSKEENIEKELNVGAEVHDVEGRGRVPSDAEGYEHVVHEVNS
ncbi:hypothetical protein A2881_02800 [Candidatus Peribacteria bacterium RIFCSPHIGHO2_01_FULL_55_13]|nr:MAG: hypothetical protein A2881_02800 [Candidatus Peribacteria bacterium RIFCSPHIGHO2_01_FULL_55_13]OGJ66552.1 MAG: hypothetical protein A3F36_02890 [Candidatus Peribacteria bacterium RIFCSPHIGHO2_12_FULL_55_11]